MIDHTHDPSLQSWVASANQPDVDFPIQNLPFATFLKSATPHVGVAIGDQILDVTTALGIPSLQAIMAMDSSQRGAVRHLISDYLSHRRPGAEQHVSPIAGVRLLLPCPIGDYTDFYASLHHATNVGGMFRPDSPLLPNYKWLPVGYHGRASSIVVSGAPIKRPWGQTSDSPNGPPSYGPSRRLDYELEVGAFLGPGNPLGQPIPIAEASDQIVGVCLLNDWSARDIQTWEYQPLGPFLAKSFATSISPWVVTAEALEPFRRSPEQRTLLPHLRSPTGDAYEISLEVWLNGFRISHTNFANMYWTFSQMVAHHTSNGCNLRPGDLIGSGTVSGPLKENRGCLLELTWKGTEPLRLPNGDVRRFLEDGDEVVLKGWCDAPGYRRISLGECRGLVV